MRLDLVAGPNGAGKSTFVRLVLAPRLPGVPFVNADAIAGRQWPDDPMGHAYEAAELAARARAAYIASGRAFIAETVFSHPSKLDLIRSARQAGFRVHLHVILVPVEQSIERVRRRVASGGHDVPEEKIRGRHDRLWALVADGVLLSNESRFYDSSSGRFDKIGGFSDGLQLGALVWPAWVHPDLPHKLGGTIEG